MGARARDARAGHLASAAIAGFFAHPILFGDRFIGMLDAEVDREHEVLRLNAVHEFVPFDPDEHELVTAEILDLAEWLGVRPPPDLG